MYKRQITAFVPTQDATGVAVATDITVTFSEAVVRGAGAIVLKDAGGATIASYDAATSGNLHFNGDTLTINPSADLAWSTGYTVEFAPGSVRDLAGNGYAGASNYHFTTTAAPDTTVPTVVIDDSLSGTASTAMGAITYTLDFSEAVTGLQADDFTLSHGAISAVTGAGTHYAVQVTPEAGFEGLLTFCLLYTSPSPRD